MIDGPSAAISGLGGLSIARDGTGGLVYVKAVSGISHVFVSALLGGQFQSPVQVDAGLAGASSQPVLAAGNGGVLLVGFINAGQLYVVDKASSTAGFGSPQALAAGASNPSLQMTNFGKGYLAFTVADAAGHDVRTAYYDNGAWSLEAAPLNVTPADDAGTGSGAPQVAAAGDGVAIVVWGEGGHVFSRRVWGTAPSVVDEQADSASISGCGEVSAGNPAVSAGGDSSYADVAFQETVSCGGVDQSRVMVNRLRASQYDGATSADGLSTPGTDSGTDPAVAMTEYGQGFVTAAGQASDNVVAMELGNNGAYGPVLQVNSLAGTAPPDPVPGVAGLFSTLVAWQQTPGTTGPAEIRVRYEPRASTLGPELVLSSPAQGPTDAARGIAADRRRRRGRGGRLGAGSDRVEPDRGRPDVSAARGGDRGEEAGVYTEHAAGAPLVGVERSLGPDHVHREPRRDPGRADDWHLFAGPGRARERPAQLAGDRDQSGEPDRSLEGRADIRRHGGAGVEGDRGGSAPGWLGRGGSPQLQRPGAGIRRRKADDPLGRRNRDAHQARDSPGRARVPTPRPLQGHGHGRRPRRQPDHGGSAREDQSGAHGAQVIRRALILAFVLALGATGVAHAQGPAYSASPPTKGALVQRRADRPLPARGNVAVPP